MMSERTEYKYDVFISYSESDEKWVSEWLVPHLRKAELAVSTKCEFVIGKEKIKNIENVVAASRHIILVLTPAWIDSEWELFAGLLARSEDPVGRKRRTIPLVRQRCAPLRAIARLIYADFTDDSECDEQLERLIATLRGQRYRTALGPPLGALLGLEAPNNFIFRRNARFINRKDELANLHDMLDIPGVVGLTGMGGVGKTQLAVEYIYLYRSAYLDGVLWINAAETLAEGFAKVGRTLCGNGYEKPMTELIQIATDYLRSHPDTLLVLDNLLDLNILNLPLDGIVVPATLTCRLLFTTRCRDVSDYRVMDITCLPPQDSLSLLLKGTHRELILNTGHLEHETARRICAVLGYLPLAVELARAYLEKFESEVTLTGYLDRLSNYGALPTVDDLEDYEAAWKYSPTWHNPVGITLASQWDALRDESARLLLRVAALLPEAKAIPVARLGLLAALSDTAEPGFPSELGKALRHAHDLSLLEAIEGSSVRLHPLAREFVAKKTKDVSNLRLFCWCANNVVAAYEDFATLQKHCKKRGIDALQEDVLVALNLVNTYSSTAAPGADIQDETEAVQNRLQMIFRILALESGHLRGWNEMNQPALFAQQINIRAMDLEHEHLAAGAADALAKLGRPYVTLGWRKGRGSLGLVRTLGRLNQIEEDRHIEKIFSSGHRIITTSDDGTLKIWNIETGKVEKTFLVGDVGSAVAVTLDDQYAVTASGSKLSVWNLQAEVTSADRILESEEDDKGQWVTPDYLYRISLSEDGNLSVYDFSHSLIQINPASPEERARIGHADDNRDVIVTPEGEYAIYTSEAGDIEVWDLVVTVPQRSFMLDVEEEMILANCPLAVSADCQYAVLATEDNVYVINLNTGRQSTLGGYKTPVHAVTISPDSRRAIIAYSGGTVKIWDLKTGRTVGEFATGLESVEDLVTTLDCRYLLTISTWSDGILKKWDLQTGQESIKIAEEALIKDACLIKVAPGARYALSISFDDVLRIWNLQTGQQEKILNGVSCEGATALSSDGRWIFSESGDGRIKVWDLRLSKPEAKHDANWHADTVYAVAITPNGRHAISASGDSMLRLWDLHTGECESIFSGHERAVRAAVITPDGHQVISGGSDGTLRVWDLENRQQECTVSAHEGEVLTVAVSRDGKHLVSGSTDLFLKVWNLKTWQEEHVLFGHERPINAVAITSDGSRILSADDRELRVWNMNTNRVDNRVECTLKHCFPVAIVSNQRFICGSMNPVLTVYSIQSYRQEGVLHFNGFPSYALAVSSDGRIAFSVSGDCALRIFNLETGKELAAIFLDNPLYSVAVARDGAIVLVGDEIGDLFCFNVLDLMPL